METTVVYRGCCLSLAIPELWPYERFLRSLYFHVAINLQEHQQWDQQSETILNAALGIYCNNDS